MEHRGYERIKQIGKGAFGAAVLCRSRKDTQLYVAKEVNLASMRPAEKQEAKNEIKVLCSCTSCLLLPRPPLPGL